MKKLIIHIEYDEDELVEHDFVERIDKVLTDLRQCPDTAPEHLGHPDDQFDMGWRYFPSLEEAKAWEDHGYPSDCETCGGGDDEDVVASGGFEIDAEGVVDPNTCLLEHDPRANVDLATGCTPHGHDPAIVSA